MSAAGLIGQALLGATHGAATGIGERLREESKLKRQKALEQTRSENSMQEAAHQSALNIGEANHGAGLTEKRDQRLHKQDKELIDYKGRQGKNDWTLLKGGNGTMIQYSPSRNESRPANIPEGAAPKNDSLTDREKYQLDMLSDEANALREKQAQGLEPLTAQEKMRLGQIEATMNTMLGGGSTMTPYQQLLAGEGGNAQPDSSQPGQGGGQPQNDPQGDTSVKGIIGTQMQQRESEKRSDAFEQKREAAIQRADAVLEKLDPGFSPGGMSGAMQEVRAKQRPQFMEEARAAAEELLALEQQGDLSDDQKRWIAERLMRLQDAGVNLNLQQ